MKKLGGELTKNSQNIYVLQNDEFRKYINTR